MISSAALLPTDTNAFQERPDVALFIDWENLKFSLRERDMDPNITALMETVQRYGRLVVARAYADWQDYYLNRSHDQASLYYAGIEPVYVPSRPDPHQARRKNSVDVKMTADALQVSFSNKHIKTFILVSGDADFIHTVNALRYSGNRVVMIGVSWATSSRLGERVDDLVFYDQEIAEAPAQLPFSDAISPNVQPANVDALVDTIVELLRRQREARFNYPPLFTWLNQQLRTAEPDFSTTRYGFLKFKDLITYAERQGKMKVITRDLVNWAALPEDEIEIDPVRMGEQDESEGSGDLEDGSDRHAFSLTTRDPFFETNDPLADHADAYADLVRMAYEIEERPNFRYMKSVYLAMNLMTRREDGAFPPCGIPFSETVRQLNPKQVHKLVAVAGQERVLYETLYTDRYAGKTFPVVRLNRAHPFVDRSLRDCSLGTGETTQDDERGG